MNIIFFRWNYSRQHNITKQTKIKFNSVSCRFQEPEKSENTWYDKILDMKNERLSSGQMFNFKNVLFCFHYLLAHSLETLDSNLKH